MRLRFPALLVLALLAPLSAQAGRVLTLGIYLWGADDSAPVQAQYVSLAEGQTEAETDGPKGYRTETHATTAEETKLVEAAIEGRMKALTLAPQPKLPAPYVTVEWHFSQDSGYAEGIAAYKLKDVPEAVLAAQKAIFGANFATPAQ